MAQMRDLELTGLLVAVLIETVHTFVHQSDAPARASCVTRGAAAVVTRVFPYHRRGEVCLVPWLL